MGKIKDSLIDDNIGNTAEPVLTHTTISMASVPGEGWSLIKIKYNPLTGEVGPMKKKYTGEFRPYIEEKLRIETIEEDIFNDCKNPWRKDS